jgi:hypothetical protein
LLTDDPRWHAQFSDPISTRIASLDGLLSDLNEAAARADYRLLVERGNTARPQQAEVQKTAQRPLKIGV